MVGSQTGGSPYMGCIYGMETFYSDFLVPYICDRGCACQVRAGGVGHSQSRPCPECGAPTTIPAGGGALPGEGGEVEEEAKDSGEEGGEEDGEMDHEANGEVLPRSAGQ